ncbi:DUF2207 domain-containing protein [Clostridiaceae bacterium HSG29]|nr:DUF2207 domain-containing protein [Clostridiaceae bacterium HSG29]
MRKKLKLLFFLIILLISVSNFCFADEYYTIDDYNIKIDVTENNVYYITEIITVDFSMPRHGIFRDIPTMLYGYSHKISDINVYDPDLLSNYNFEVSNNGSNIQIKIGDADIYVDNSKKYQIEYIYDAGDDLIKDYDEFYFNVIGTEWDTPIRNVDFQINMPKKFNNEKLNITSGYFGSTISENVEFSVDNMKITGNVKNLANYQGVTVALNLDEGYFTDVSKAYSMVFIYLLLAILIFILLGSIYFRSANYGSNKIIPVLNFYSPDDLNPSEISYVFNEEKLSNDDMASIIIYWASKGYLKIYEVEKKGIFSKDSMYFERLVEFTALGNGYEYHLFKDMFKLGDGKTVKTSDLKHEFYENLNVARSLVRDRYRGKREILENNFQYGIIALSIVLAILTALTLSTYLKVLMGVPYLFVLIFSFIVFVVFFLILYSIATRKNKKSSKKKFLKIFKYVFFIAFIVKFFDIIKEIIKNIDFNAIKFNSLSMLMLISIILYMITIYSIAKIKKYSTFAKDLLNNIYGFKNFLETAKLDKLEMLFKDNPEYYYDMLPYVMVFGLTEIWDKRIKDLTLEGPSWYVSNRPFTTYYMMNSFNHSFAEMSSPPSNSSSSSGGSVGGGGGGGGGGSW